MTKKEFLGIINDIDDDFVRDYFTGSYQDDNVTVQPIYTRQKTAHGWKSIFPAAAAICVVMAVIIGGIKLANINLNETVPANSGENPANVDTVINPEVERANKIAGTANDFLTVFLSDAIMGGYGYNGSDQTLSNIVLFVKDGVWSCQSQMYGYGSNDEMSWCGEAKDITAETSYFKSAEEKLCAEFASVEIENFEGFENINGVFTFVISQGAPRTAFIEGSPEEIIIEMDLEMFNPKDYDGNFPEKYKWSGGEAGVAKDKKTGKTVVVGTFPVVKMGDEEIPRQEETAHTYAYKNAKSLYETVNNFLTSYCPNNGIEINKLDEPQTITMTISYGRYNATADEDLVSQDDYGKFIIRIINNVEDEYDYSSGWFKAYIVNGECKGIVFMANAAEDIEDFLSYPLSYPSYEDFQKGSYHWDRLDDIGYVNGIAMGVYPELPYEEAFETTPQPSATPDSSDWDTISFTQNMGDYSVNVSYPIHKSDENENRYDVEIKEDNVFIADSQGKTVSAMPLNNPYVGGINPGLSDIDVKFDVLTLDSGNLLAVRFPMHFGDISSYALTLYYFDSEFINYIGEMENGGDFFPLIKGDIKTEGNAIFFTETDVKGNTKEVTYTVDFDKKILTQSNDM